VYTSTNKYCRPTKSQTSKFLNHLGLGSEKKGLVCTIPCILNQLVGASATASPISGPGGSKFHVARKVVSATKLTLPSYLWAQLLA
jgi:hypothetical protein